MTEEGQYDAYCDSSMLSDVTGLINLSLGKQTLENRTEKFNCHCVFYQRVYEFGDTIIEFNPIAGSRNSDSVETGKQYENKYETRYPRS